MKQLPTAEEFCREKHSKIDPRISWIDFNKEVMIEFAKLHVEAALRTASVLAELKDIGIDEETGVGESNLVVDKQSILTAYPLGNIK